MLTSRCLVTENPDYKTVELNDDNALLGPALKVPAFVNGVKSDVIMLPFANAGKWRRNEKDTVDKIQMRIRTLSG